MEHLARDFERASQGMRSWICNAKLEETRSTRPDCMHSGYEKAKQTHLGLITQRHRLQTVGGEAVKWCTRRDSNPKPPDP